MSYNSRGGQNMLEQQVNELRQRLDTLESNLAENYANLNAVLNLLMETEQFNKDERKEIIKRCTDGNCERIPPGCANHHHH